MSDYLKPRERNTAITNGWDERNLTLTFVGPYFWKCVTLG